MLKTGWGVEKQMTSLVEKKLDDKKVKILAIFGLITGFAYLIYYMINRVLGTGAYTIFFVLLYLLLPVITLLFFVFPSYEKALTFLVIQNFIELLLNANIITWSWIFSFLFFLVLVIPQIIVLKHIEEPIKMKKTTKTILIMLFMVFSLVYISFVIFAIWKVLQPESISNGSFSVYILYITRYLMRLVSYSCITLLLYRFFAVNKEQVEQSHSV